MNQRLRIAPRIHETMAQLRRRRARARKPRTPLPLRRDLELSSRRAAPSTSYRARGSCAGGRGVAFASRASGIETGRGARDDGTEEEAGDGRTCVP